MAKWLRQSTAYTFRFGPFVDSTDGDSEENALTIAYTDVLLSKAGGAYAAKNDTTNLTGSGANAHYTCPLNATDLNTLGSLRVWCHVSGALPVWVDFLVVPAQVYDSLVAGTDALQVDTIQLSGTGQTAQDLGAFVTAILTDTSITLDDLLQGLHSKVDTVDSLVDTLIARIIGTLAAGTHNPQSGDAYSRLGVAGAGLSAITDNTSEIPTLFNGRFQRVSRITAWSIVLGSSDSFPHAAGTSGIEIRNSLSAFVWDEGQSNFGEWDINTEVYTDLNPGSQGYISLSGYLWGGGVMADDVIIKLEGTFEAGALPSYIYVAIPKGWNGDDALVGNDGRLYGGARGEKGGPSPAEVVGIINLLLTVSRGTGSVAVNHNYGGANNLAYKTAGGVGIDNAIVRVYLKSDYDAGNRSSAFVVSWTKTNVDGEWENDIYLDPETYTIVFEKQGEYGPDTKEQVVS